MAGGGFTGTGGSSHQAVSGTSSASLTEAKPTLYLTEIAFHSEPVWLGKLNFCSHDEGEKGV